MLATYIRRTNGMAKKKKDKVVYVDDNRTIADMSHVDRNGYREKSAPKKKVDNSYASKKDTFFTAMRMMVKPMLFVLIVLTASFLLMYLWASCAG